MSIAVESLTRSLASDTSGCLTAMVLDVENRIYAPKLPLISIIPNGMTAGKSILVKGLVTGKHRNNFAINLCCGLLTDGLHRDNIALHVNPRFDNEHKLVLNSLIDDTWGPEERHKNPLRKGQAFMIRITALPDLFKIAFNYDVTIEYLHRVPLSDIKTIQIEGCVIVDAMEYFAAPPTRRTDGLTKTPESARSSIKADPFILYAQALPFSLPVNYKEALPLLRFTMWVLKSPYRIEMDFLAGDDIAFHSSVRFDEQAIVRNVQRRGKWENEERLLDIFPFQASCTYEIEIHCLPEHFVVRVGGSHCYNFTHRLRPQLIDRFNLKGNARLLKFCLE